MKKRDAIIVEHLGHVENVANAVSRMWDGRWERDELISIGNLALVEAAGRWDDTINDSEFWGWAHIYVRWAMVDAIRHWTRWHRRLRISQAQNVELSETVEEGYPQYLSSEDSHAGLYLWDALRHLRKEQARLIFECLLFGVCLHEIGERRNVSESAMCQHLTVARRAAEVYL